MVEHDESGTVLTVVLGGVHVQSTHVTKLLNLTSRDEPLDGEGTKGTTAVMCQ